MKKEITIYDIAKKLGISAATVSRGLANHGAISADTKKRIQQAAVSMGYRSNNFASNLRTQKSNTIGIIVHELNSQFITSVLSGIEKVTAEAGLDIIIGHSSETAEKEIANVHNFFHKRVDGLIASLAYDTQNTQHYAPFFRKGIPVVFFDRVESSGPGTRVVIDNVKAGFDATTHLLQQGCTRIAHITGSLTRNVYADRLTGYRQALAAKNLDVDNRYLLVNDLGEEASREAALTLAAMRPRPDGVFITNDFCAAVCIKTWKELGIKVPQEIAVVGFNNDAISKLVEPAITTINYPGEEMGEAAARCLLEQLEHKSGDKKGKSITIHSELLVRDSSLRT